MMSRRTVSTMFVASMLLGVLVMGVRAQRSPSSSKNPQTKKAPPPQVFTKRATMPARPLDAETSVENKVKAQEQTPWHVGIDRTLKLDPDSWELYERVANTMRGVKAVPDARIHQFSAVQDPPRVAIKGWTSMVRSVEPAGDGYIVIISVSPILTSTMGFTMIGMSYRERYFINVDNHVQYIESLDPYGTAGQEPLFYTSG